MSDSIKQTNWGCGMSTIGLAAIALAGISFICTLAFGMSGDAGLSTLTYIGMIAIPIFLVIGVVGILAGIATGSIGAFRQIAGHTQENNAENSLIAPSTTGESQIASKPDGKIPLDRIVQAGFIGLAIGILSICPALAITNALSNYLIDLYQAPANLTDFLYPIIIEPVCGIIGGGITSTMIAARLKRPKASQMGGIAGGILFSIIGLFLISGLIYLGYAR